MGSKFIRFVLLLAFSFMNLLLFQNCANKNSSSDATPAPTTTSYYYVDATNGSDNSDGTTESTAWKTLSKVSSATFTTGTTIYLKKGEIWYEQLTIPSSGVTIDAYGSGSLPIINGSKTLTGTWTTLAGGVYSQSITLASDESFGNISENGNMLAPVDWISNFTTTFASASTGTYSYDFATKTIYIKPTASPAGKTYVISVKHFGITAVSKSDIMVKNVNITRFSLNGVNYVDCIRCSVKTSTITNGGGTIIYVYTQPHTPDYMYAGNGIEYDNMSSDGLVEGVNVSQIFDSCISPQTYINNQTLNGMIYKDSVLDKCGFAGIEISILSNFGTTGNTLSNVTVSGMTITDMGKGWSGRRYGTEGHGIRIQADPGAGTMTGMQISNSTITGSAGSGIKLLGQIDAVNISRTSLSSNIYGVEVTDTSSTNLKLILSSSLIYGNSSYGVLYNAPTAAGFNLFHNTFYNNNAINFAVFNQVGEAKIRNNIFYSSAPMTHIYVASTLAGAAVNNNCYNNVANMFGYNSVAYSTVAAFNAATGFEANGTGGTVGLTNASSGDFSLLVTSQCRSIGATTTGVSTDYSGYSYANPPAAGAYEYR